NQVGGYGVLIAQTAGSTVVQGNFIGTNLDGDGVLPNAGSGVFITTNLAVTVGGTTEAERNVIAGNKQFGGMVQNAGAPGVKTQGTYIGINAAGTASLGGQLAGVNVVDSKGVVVGGGAGAGNVISGHVNSGVAVSGGSSNVIRGNMIGTDPAGTFAIPNQ